MKRRQDSLDDLQSRKQLLEAERRARLEAEVEAASAEAAVMQAKANAARAAADVSSAEALIAGLKPAIEKLRRQLCGQSSKRGHKIVASQALDQLELTLEEFEATATGDEIVAEMAAAKTKALQACGRRQST